MPQSPNCPPGVEQGRLAGRKQQRADRWPPEAIEPATCRPLRAHGSVRPSSGPAGSRWRNPTCRLDDNLRRPLARAKRLAVPKPRCCADQRTRRDWRRARGSSGNQAGTVGDEYIPRNRGAVSGEFFDRRHVERRLRLVSARRARQQHAEQPRGMQSLQQRLRDAPRALDLVGRGDDLRPELAGAGERVRTRSGCPCVTSDWQGIAAAARGPGSPTRGISTACRWPRSRQSSIAAAPAPARHR